MPEQSDTQENEAQEGEETTQPETEVSENKELPALSLDEAIEVALEHHEGPKEESKPAQVKEAAAAPEEKEEEIEAPSEFNAQEKEAWHNGDRRGISAAWNRINASRLAHINNLTNEIQRAKAAPQSKEDDPNARVVAAIKANPIAAVHQILKVRGLTPEQVFNQEQQQALERDDQLGTLRSTVEELNSWRQQQEIERVGQQFGQVFDSLQGAKTAAGEPVYPDLTEDESGYRLAKAIGSLAVSPQLQAAVRFRNPGAGLLDFSREAYKLLGGRVIESNQSPRSQESTQKHINQAKRARISTPGKAPGTLRSVTAEKKYSSLDSAIERALELTED